MSAESSLEEYLVPCIQSIFHPEAATRQEAEAQIEAWAEQSPDYPHALCQLICTPEIDTETRQLAAVLLRKYVPDHWDLDPVAAEKALQVPEEVKAAIREMLPQGLADPSSRVRSSVAYVIAVMAEFDWPDHWPNLFDTLTDAISADDPNAVHGGMRVLKEFSEEVTAEQLEHVLPELLPRLQNMFEQVEFGVRVRSRAIAIYKELVNRIYIMNSGNSKVDGGMLAESLPFWLEAFTAMMTEEDEAISDIGLKTEAMSCVGFIMMSHPKAVAKFLPQMLPSLWAMFVGFLDQYSAVYIAGTADEPEVIDDEDGEVLGLESLLASILNVIRIMAESTHSMYRAMIKEYMGQLVLYTITYAQMTVDQAERWMDDVTAFVLDEVDEDAAPSTNTLRIVAQDVLGEILEMFGDEAMGAVLDAANTMIETGLGERAEENSEWWKKCEAALLAYTVAEEKIVEKLEEGVELPFDMGVLTERIAEFVSAGDVPFLQGRALTTGMKFTKALDDEFCGSLLDGALSILENHEVQAAPVLISAIESIASLCSQLGEARKDLIAPRIQMIMETLIIIAPKASVEVLSIILDTITLAVKLQPEAGIHFERQLGSLITACFIKYYSDSFVCDSVVSLVGTLAKTPEMIPCLEERLLATVFSVLEKYEQDEFMCIIPPALEMLTAMVQGCPALTETLFDTGFPTMMNVLLNSVDLSVVLAGTSCLRAYLHIAAKQVQGWSDGTTTGQELILNVFRRQLDPDFPETGMDDVGKTITQYLKKAEDVDGDLLEGIFDAVLGKLATLRMTSSKAEMIFVIAQWITMDAAQALEFLATRDALEPVLRLWCDTHEDFSYNGKYYTNVSAMALIAVLKSGDERLYEITVDGDEIYDVKGIRTRAVSAVKPQRFQQVPVVAKIAKLLIREFGSLLEDAKVREGGGDEEYDVEEDDDDDAWEDQDDMSSFAKKSPFAPAEFFDLSEALDIGKLLIEEDIPEEDELDDELYHVDLMAEIAGLLRDLSSDEAALEYVMPHLNAAEQRTAAEATSS